MGGDNIFNIREHFKGKSVITLDDLREYFAVQEPKLKDSTLRWRIYYLKENQILLPIKRGTYSLNQKPFLKPQLNRQLRKIHSILEDSYSPDLNHVLWTSEWLSQFMVQQPVNSIIIVETEKDWLNSVFSDLQPYYKNVYLHPGPEVVRDYISVQKEAIVVKPLISRAPVYETKEYVKVARLEKILVDVFCDSYLFISYQGTELETIFINAWKTYSLNLSVMLNYAKRRKRGDALQDFLKKSHNQELHNLISQ